jgi:hypothetical protein
LAYEEAHHGDTHEEGLHGFTSLREIIVLDGGSDELGLSLGVLNVNEASRCKWPGTRTVAEGGLTYFKTVKSFLLRI